MQLNRYIALCGVTSRRKANALIHQGRVSVNDETVEMLGRVVDSEKDIVCLDSQRLRPPKRYRYLLMNKPNGAITSVLDGRGRKTVLDFVDVDDRLFPVGRLDYDTEGVLLLTNDGKLAYRLTHPKYEMEKVYEAWVDGRVGQSDLQKLAEGVVLNGSVRVCGEARILGRRGGQTLVEIRVHEGKKRQIKRMMKAVDHPVVALRRTCFAGLTVDGLDRGTYRDLTEEEVKALYRQVGLSQ
jgi:pseudouridine synthase